MVMTLQEKCDLIIENLEDAAVIKLMQQFGADRYKDEETFILFPTICHNEVSAEASMKLYYYKDSHLFMCYTSCGGMNIFNFIKHYYETRGIEFDWYEDVFLVAQNCSTNKELSYEKQPTYEKKHDRYKKRELITLPEYNKGVLDVFTKFYPPEWIEDGITKEAMDKFNILYSIPQNKIIIPHHDVNGRLVGIRGRALNEWEVELGAKYMPVQIEKTWYKHKLSMNLYGLFQNKNNIINTGICYIFESEKSVMQCENFDMVNSSVAICGSSLNIFQVKLLIEQCHPKEIVLCLDKEELPGEDKYLKKLIAQCEKYKNYCNFSYIYDSDNLLQLKDSPSDKGEEVFMQLLYKRRKVK